MIRYAHMMKTHSSRLAPSNFPFSCEALLNDSPKELWFRGTLPPIGSHRYITIVGARNHSPYGERVCQSLISGLSRYPFIVVSGLAIGIDGIAHTAALDAGLTTIAFPGSGLSEEMLYPKFHAHLAERICESGGALFSEWHDMQKSAPWTFPRRNRIMAAIADAVIVIEARHGSGSLITAYQAIEMGKTVMAVPGNIDSELSRGTNNLIKQGAIPITSSADILEYFNMTVVESSPQTMLPLFTAEEQIIINLLSEPRGMSELIRLSGLPPSAATVLVGTMEIAGYIRERYGKMERKI